MPSSYRSNDSQANKDWIWKHVSIWLQIVLLFTVWWDDLEFPWLLLKLEKKRTRAALMLPLVCSRKETLTHYWHLCVWGVKCYITQRSEKSKRLEAEMEKAGEASLPLFPWFFSLAKMKLKALREIALFSLTVMKSGAERILPGKPLRRASEPGRRLHGCVCERQVAVINNNMLWEYEKCDLYSTTPHIFQIYIFTYFIQWI